MIVPPDISGQAGGRTWVKGAAAALPHLTVGDRPVAIDRRLLLVAISIAVVAMSAYIVMAASWASAYNLSLGAMLLLAGVFGLRFHSARGFRASFALALATAAAATLGMPDLGRQFDEGAFWIALGWLAYFVLALGAWAIGSFMRVLYRTIVATRP